MGIIYLDYHATSPVDPRVARAMWPFFSRTFGNPQSAHAVGLKSKKATEQSRQAVAFLIGADAREIVFTSGATESNNLAIKGVAGVSPHRNHIIAVQTEHKSVLDPCRRLETQGFHTTYLPVNSDGLLDLEKLKNALTPKTVLVSVMLANNEIGTIQPIREIAKILKTRNVLLHCDAAQAVGKIPVDVKKLGVDLLSFTAHKLCGPKGVGALYVRKTGAGVGAIHESPLPILIPMLDGGGHEGGMRSGTLNVPGIVGFGKACEIAKKEMARESKRIARLRDRLLAGILKATPDARVNGSLKSRLPNNLNICLTRVGARRAVPLPKYFEKQGIMVSSGSACLSTSPEPSYVLKALGVPEDLRRQSVRFGLGRFTTQTEVDFVVKYWDRFRRDYGIKSG